MKLWHIDLIPYLPRQQLLGQHRECCALRGMGWGKKHATVDYVFEYPIGKLVGYHLAVIAEMEYRGYKPNPHWYFPGYRGKNLPEDITIRPIYSRYIEHDDEYLKECKENLRRKGVTI